MYYTRNETEKLLGKVCREIGEKQPTNLHSLSDYQLLCKLNYYLIKGNCVPLTPDELEIDLI